MKYEDLVRSLETLLEQVQALENAMSDVDGYMWGMHEPWGEGHLVLLVNGEPRFTLTNEGLERCYRDTYEYWGGADYLRVRAERNQTEAVWQRQQRVANHKTAFKAALIVVEAVAEESPAGWTVELQTVEQRLKTLGCLDEEDDDE